MKQRLKIIILLTIAILGMAVITSAQTTINPDTVCVNAVGEQYFTPTSTYQWTITGGGGTLQTGQGSNSITADWGGVSGLYLNAVEVIESNVAGCPGTPIILDVFVLDLSGNPIGPFCAGDPTTPLVGNPA